MKTFCLYAIFLLFVFAGFTEAKPQKPRPKPIPSLTLGKKTYTQLCDLCHGVKGYGDGPQAKHLRTKPSPFGKGHFRHGRSFQKILRNINQGFSKQGMPSYLWLPLKKRTALVRYILFLSQAGKKKKKKKSQSK